MTIAERLNENLKLAQETAGPYVESARKNAGVAFASVQEKLGRGHTGGMHHSASSKDVTVRHFIEPSSGSQLASTPMFCCLLQLIASRWLLRCIPPDLPRSPFFAFLTPTAQSSS